MSCFNLPQGLRTGPHGGAVAQPQSSARAASMYRSIGSQTHGISAKRSGKSPRWNPDIEIPAISSNAGPFVVAGHQREPAVASVPGVKISRVAAIGAPLAALAFGWAWFARRRRNANATATTAVAEHDSLRLLAERIEKAREDERVRLAREVHDDLGQRLALMRFQLARLRRTIDEPEQRRELVEQLMSLVDESINGVQRITGALRQCVLDRVGLAAAMEWHVGQFRSATAIECITDLENVACDPAAARALFRIAQEALTNVLRHSGARRVSVSLHELNERVTLTICDMGRGFDPDKVTAVEGLGLLGMRERAEAVGGHLMISSAPGRGTTVIATMPRTDGEEGDL